jgi:opacity protein-like surface antigen
MPYAETTAGFGSAHTKLENLEGQDEAYKDKDNLILVTAGAGVAFIITERVSFDLMGGYSFYRQKDPDDNPDNVRYTTGSFGLRFGVSMYLGKK